MVTAQSLLSTLNLINFWESEKIEINIHKFVLIP